MWMSSAKGVPFRLSVCIGAGVHSGCRKSEAYFPFHAHSAEETRHFLSVRVAVASTTVWQSIGLLSRASPEEILAMNKKTDEPSTGWARNPKKRI